MKIYYLKRFFYLIPKKFLFKVIFVLFLLVIFLFLKNDVFALTYGNGVYLTDNTIVYVNSYSGNYQLSKATNYTISNITQFNFSVGANISYNFIKNRNYRIEFSLPNSHFNANANLVTIQSLNSVCHVTGNDLFVTDSLGNSYPYIDFYCSQDVSSILFIVSNSSDEELIMTNNNIRWNYAYLRYANTSDEQISIDLSITNDKLDDINGAIQDGTSSIQGSIDSASDDIQNSITSGANVIQGSIDSASDELKQSIEDSTKTCFLYNSTVNFNDKSTVFGLISDNGTLTRPDITSYKVSDFIKIYGGYTYSINLDNVPSSNYYKYAIYDEKKNFLFVRTYTSNDTIDLSNYGTILYYRIVVNASHTPVIVSNQNICVDRSIYESDKLTSSITDSTVDDDVGTSFFDGFEDNDNGGISGIVSAPLNLINTLLSNESCSPLSADVLGTTVEFPCGEIIWDEVPNSFINIYWTFFCGFCSYFILRKLFKDIEGLKSPSDKGVDTLDL